MNDKQLAQARKLLAQAGGLARQASMSTAERSAHGSHAIRIRWHKHKLKKSQEGEANPPNPAV